MSLEGTCKKWFGDRGFGFIARSDEGDDIFVHFTGITQPGRKSLNIGEKVTFDLGSDQKSGQPRAENVSGDGTGKSSEELYPNKTFQKNNFGNNTGGNTGAPSFGAPQPNYYQQQPPSNFGGNQYVGQPPQQQQYSQYGQQPNMSYGYPSEQYGQQNQQNFGGYN